MGSRERDENTGKFTEEYPLSEFTNVLEENGPAGTTEIADIIGCDRRTAYLKLQSLEDEGEVENRKVGNALLWSLVEK